MQKKMNGFRFSYLKYLKSSIFAKWAKTFLVTEMEHTEKSHRNFNTASRIFFGSGSSRLGF